MQAKYQPYGSENESRKYGGLKEDQLSRSESYGSLQQSHGIQSALKVSIPNSNAKASLVSNQRSNYKKIGNTDPEYQVNPNLRQAGGTQLKRGKDGQIAQQSHYTSSLDKNGGSTGDFPSAALQKSIGKAEPPVEKDEYDSYVAGLKKEHTLYQNKLQEL